MQLVVTVRNKIATGGNRVIVADNDDYTVLFDTDSQWDELSPQALVVLPDGQTYTREVNGGVASLPPLRGKYIKIGLVAGDVRTTTPAVFPILPSIREGSRTEHEPAPDVYAQLLEQIGALVQRIEALENGLPNKPEESTSIVGMAVVGLAVVG